MIYKKFNKKNHDENDKPSKDLVIKFLKSKGVDAVENPNDYGIDIMTGRYEVERRIIWKNKFPFKTVHIPSRKTKFLKYNIMYAVVNRDFNKIMLCHSRTIRRYKQIEVPNKSVASGEYFYDVPLQEWSVYEI